MRQYREPKGVERIILAVLAKSGKNALCKEQLERRSGLPAASFKEAMIRLVRKDMIVEWKNERHENFVVAYEFRHEATYSEEVEINPLFAILGGTGTKVKVERSIPFIGLPDESDSDLPWAEQKFKKVKFNRYRLLDTPVASVA